MVDVLQEDCLLSSNSGLFVYLGVCLAEFDVSSSDSSSERLCPPEIAGFLLPMLYDVMYADSDRKSTKCAYRYHS